MVCVEPFAQCTSNFGRTVCATENTTKLCSAVSNTFHIDMGKRNPYESKIRRPRPEPTLALVTSSVYNTSYMSRAVKALC
jgi:hypothetical protein